MLRRCFIVPVFMAAIVLFSCKKVDQTTEEKIVPNTSGKVELLGMNPGDLEINSETDIVTLSQDSTFRIQENVVLMVDNVKLDKAVYFGICGADERANYVLNAKETALYFMLCAIPGIKREYYKPAIRNIKNALYQYQEVKALEKAIERSVRDKQYLDLNQISGELGAAVDRLLTNVEAERVIFLPKKSQLQLNDQVQRKSGEQTSSSTGALKDKVSGTQQSSGLTLSEALTSGDVYIPSSYAAGKGYYRVGNVTGSVDVFNSGDGSYTIERRFYNRTAAVVGLMTGKYDPQTDLLTGQKIFGYVSPYYPPDLLSVSGTQENLEQLMTTTLALQVHGWNGFSNTDAYSENDDFSFTVDPLNRNAIVFANGSVDESITAINIAYLFVDNIFDALDLSKSGSSKESLMSKFFVYMVTELNVTGARELKAMWDNKEYIQINNKVNQIVSDFLLKEAPFVARSTEKIVKRFVGKKLFKQMAALGQFYTASRIAYKVSSAILISTSPQFAVAIPIEFKTAGTDYSPFKPSPFNVSLNSSGPLQLKWEVNNPSQQALRYTVYLSNTFAALRQSPIAQSVVSREVTYSKPLLFNTRYYWQVDVIDPTGKVTRGAVWMFDVGKVSEQSQGLIAYYPLDGNANDESGNGNHGSLQNSPVFEAGVRGQAVKLTGRCDFGMCEGTGGDHILIPMVQFDTYASYSINIWVKEAFLAWPDGESYISFGSDQQNIVSIGHYGNSIRFSSSSRSLLDIPFAASNVNAYQMYTLVYDKGVLKGYQNGKLVGTLTNAENKVGGNYSAIARHWGISDYTRFTGSIDQVRIYSRALSDGEIRTFYETKN